MKGSNEFISPDCVLFPLGNPPVLNVTCANVSSAVYLDTSDLSFRQLQPDNSGAFKQPNVPYKKKKVVNSKVVKKPKFICTYCLKGYQSEVL